MLLSMERLGMDNSDALSLIVGKAFIGALKI